MLKNISNIWKLNLSELYMMLATIFGGGILVMIVMAIVLAADQESTVAAGGTFMALLLWAMVNVILGMMGSENNFNMIVSLGCRRKDYMISQMVTVYLNMLIEVAAVFVLYMIEKPMWKMIYPNREYEKLVEYAFEPKILLAIMLLIPAIRLFMGAAILKFGKIAYWFIWAVWMVCSFGGGKLVTYIAHHPQSWIFAAINNVKDMSAMVQMISICLITGVLLGLTYHFTKKQAVYA